MLSLVIPAYNCSDTIRESVNSVIFGNADAVGEIVIVDDGSSDETPFVLAELMSLCPMIRVITHRANEGGAAARNTACEAASGELIFCLDADNVLVPGSLEGLWAFALQKGADVASFRGLDYFVGTTDNVTHKWIFKEGEIGLEDYLSGQIVPGASGNYLFRKKAWKSVGGYPANSGALDSWGFGLRLVATEKRMIVMKDGFYFHRYGHQSYWIREARKANVSALAKSLLEPFYDLLSPTSVQMVLSAPETWFDNLDTKPLATRSVGFGIPGILIDHRSNLSMLRARIRNALSGKS